MGETPTWGDDGGRDRVLGTAKKIGTAFRRLDRFGYGGRGIQMRPRLNGRTYPFLLPGGEALLGTDRNGDLA